MNRNHQQESSGFNWGKGLLIVIVLFICTTLGIVAFLMSLDYQIVTENYYEKAENYEQHIEEVEHARALSEPVGIALLQESEHLEIQFPAGIPQDELRGTIELYRPSDSSMDQKIALNVDKNGIQQIATADLARGKWLVKVSWTSGDKSYFKEKNIFLSQ